MTQRQVYVLVPAFYAAMAIATLLWRWLAHLPLGKDLWFAHGAAGAAVIVGIAGSGLVLVITEVFLHRLGWVDFLERSFHQLLGRVTVARAFWLAALSSIGEELFFRGAIQPTFGIVAASVIFGLLHSGPDVRYLIWTFFALATGLFLGLLAQRTGGVLAPVLTHFLVNFHNLLSAEDVGIPPAWMRSRWSRAGG